MPCFLLCFLLLMFSLILGKYIFDYSPYTLPFSFLSKMFWTLFSVLILLSLSLSLIVLSFLWEFGFWDIDDECYVFLGRYTVDFYFRFLPTYRYMLYFDFDFRLLPFVLGFIDSDLEISALLTNWLVSVYVLEKAYPYFYGLLILLPLGWMSVFGLTLLDELCDNNTLDPYISPILTKSSVFFLIFLIFFNSSTRLCPFPSNLFAIFNPH